MQAKKIFGLDISDRSIEALQLERSGKTSAISSYARVALRAELSVNGVIKKPDQLSSAIKELLRSAKPKPITTPYCVLSLPESQVFTTIFSLPAGLKRNEIFQTISVKAEEVIPFSAKDIYFDFRVIRLDASKQEVFYVAVPKKIVDAYVAVLKKVKLIPVALDVESISAARATVALSRHSAEPVLLADIGARTTTASVFDRNGIRESRIIKLAGSHLTRALAKKLSISAKEAEALKIKNGLDEAKQSAPALAALQKECARLAAELQKFSSYYYREHQRRVGEAVLVGGSALVPQLDQFLAKTLKIPVRRGDPFISISDPKNILKQKGKSTIFANVIGVALRGIARNVGTSDINLLPLTEKPPRRLPHWLAPVLMIILALAAVGAAVIIRFYPLNFFAPMPTVNKTLTPVAPSTPVDKSFSTVSTSTATSTSAVSNIATSTATTTALTLGKVKIRQTTIGYINVREQPNTASRILGRATTGQEFPIIAEQSGWIQITFSTTTNGWVSGVYVDKSR